MPPELPEHSRIESLLSQLIDATRESSGTTQATVAVLCVVAARVEQLEKRMAALESGRTPWIRQ